MAKITTTYGHALLNWYWAAQSVTPPSTFYLGLATNNGNSGFTEMSGSGYTREIISFGTANSNTVVSNVDVVFGPVTGSNWPTIYQFGIFDASSGGNMLISKFVEPITTMTVGNSYTFLSGSIQVLLG